MSTLSGEERSRRTMVPKLADSITRMLSPSEIESLRQRENENNDYLREAFPGLKIKE